jgi:site-specific DNA recombinase
MTGPQCIAIYCRFSTRRDGGSESVRHQETWGREYAAQQWPGIPVELFMDDGITAAKSDVHRPDFQRLREWIADGKVTHLWTVEQSRLARTNAGWFSFADELESAGIVKLHTRRQGILPVSDLGTDVGAVVATHETRQSTKRVRDDQDARAAEGLPGGGVTFGYIHEVDNAKRAKVLTLVPEQADVIREAATRVLDGEPLSSIARDLTARGVVGVKGGPVGPSTIRSWVTSPTIAGKRQHRGQIVGDGKWTAILDETTWRACVAKLDRMTERKERPGRRSYLLTGLLECPDGHRMTGARKYSGGKVKRSRPAYECKVCGGLTISADAVDDHVRDRLLDRLEELVDLSRSVDESEARRKAITDGLATIDRKRQQYGTMLADDDMDIATYGSARERLRQQEAAYNAELAAMPTTDDAVDPEAVREGWAGATIDERRALISRFVDAIVIERARPGAPRTVDLGRVRIEGPAWV